MWLYNIKCTTGELNCFQCRLNKDTKVVNVFNVFYADSTKISNLEPAEMLNLQKCWICRNRNIWVRISEVKTSTSGDFIFWPKNSEISNCKVWLNPYHLCIYILIYVTVDRIEDFPWNKIMWHLWLIISHWTNCCQNGIRTDRISGLADISEQNDFTPLSCVSDPKLCDRIVTEN